MTNPRPVCPDELKELGQLLDSVFRIPRGITDQHMLTDFPLLFRPDNLQNCRVIVEDGRIVSHAGLWPRQLVIDDTTLKVGILVAVATHPDNRHRGQAAALVKSLQQTLRDEEYDLGILWTGVPDFYRKLGWEVVRPDGHVVEVSSYSEIPCEQNEVFEVVPYSELQRSEEIVGLHERESVRMTRSHDEWATLLRLSKVSTLIATEHDLPVAYLVFSRAVNKPGWIECGGSLEGIVSLLNYSLKSESPAEPSRWLISPTRVDLADWAQAAGMNVRPMESSKGMANEMILNCRPERVSQELIERLFVWGLDLA